MVHKTRIKMSGSVEMTVFIVFTFLCISECHPKVVGFHKATQMDSSMLSYSEPVNGGENSLPISNYLSKSDYSEKTKDLVPVLDEEDDLIPDSKQIVLVFRPDDSLSATDIVNTLCAALSKVLHIPFENIKKSTFQYSSGMAKFYFTRNMRNDDNDVVFISSSNILPLLSVAKLQNETDLVKIIDVRGGEDIFSYVKPTDGQVVFSGKKLFISREEKWRAWKLVVIVVCSIFALISVLIVIYFLSTCQATKNSVQPPTSKERQVVLHPVMKPSVTGVNVVQPENKDSFITETDSEHTPSPCCSPMRVKGKGLLERRGSSASLTLDLNRSQENVHYGTPPKECSAEEFLMSAVHRLTRKQLHNCLKDVKSLHSEFWEIPMNHPEKVQVAGCGTKNRYKTILPNESSRVDLKTVGDDPFTSYINANYVRGYGGEKNAYIATQGPMTHTINDFWLMVWEQKSPMIVMITKLKEKLKVKCESYLPDCVGHFSGIEVAVLREIPRDGYTIRELLMKKGREIHNVCHFWYTAWPDHKTPDTAKQLLSMSLEVEDLRRNGNRVKGPTVVHCSAGIGRTGCFIAISTGIKQLMEEDTVDVLGTVCGLRLDRGGMVQTAEQYEFVHQALSVFEMTMSDQSGE